MAPEWIEINPRDLACATFTHEAVWIYYRPAETILRQHPPAMEPRGQTHGRSGLNPGAITVDLPPERPWDLRQQVNQARRSRMVSALAKREARNLRRLRAEQRQKARRLPKES